MIVNWEIMVLETSMEGLITIIKRRNEQGTHHDLWAEPTNQYVSLVFLFEN